jgi:hypothetical protein
VHISIASTKPKLGSQEPVCAGRPSEAVNILQLLERLLEHECGCVSELCFSPPLGCALAAILGIFLYFLVTKAAMHKRKPIGTAGAVMTRLSQN